MNILVDTDVLIDYSKKRSRVLEDLKNQGCQLYLSPINVAEFLNNKNLIDNPRKQKQADEFVSLFRVPNISAQTAKLASFILRSVNNSYLGDAFIAAVCLENKFKLLTRNKKHFEKIKGLKFYQ